jgi:2'-5' RNA ligase
MLDIPEWGNLLSQINKEDLADGGLETEPHVTILYGLHHSKVNLDLLKSFKNVFPIEITKLSLFENEDQDVLKFEVDNPLPLKVLYSSLKFLLPNTQTYDEYSPHCTVAYLKPGRGKKYLYLAEDFNFKIESDNFIYSDPNKNHIKL